MREKLPEVAVQLKMGPTRFISEMARNSPLLFVLYPPKTHITAVITWGPGCLKHHLVVKLIIKNICK